MVYPSPSPTPPRVPPNTPESPQIRKTVDALSMHSARTSGSRRRRSPVEGLSPTTSMSSAPSAFSFTAFGAPAPFGATMGPPSSASSSHTSPQMVNSQMFPRQDTMILHSKVASLCQEVQRLNGIPPEIIAYIVNEIREIGSAFNSREMQTFSERDQLYRERDNIRATLSDNQRLLSNALAERDRACRERDALSSRNSNFEGTREVDADVKSVNARLQEKVRLQEEQLSGKRSLWLDNHPTSSLRHGGQPERDPYTTPSAAPSTSRSSRHSGPHAGSARNLQETFQRMLDESGPVTPLTREALQEVPLVSSGGLLPPSRDSLHRAMNIQFPPSGSRESRTRGTVLMGDAAPTRDTAVAHVALPTRSTALVMFRTEDDEAHEFEGDIRKTWDLVKQLCLDHFSVPNTLEEDKKLATMAELWPFILTLSYNDPHDAATQAVTLLRDPETRSAFVMRIIVSFITRNMWHLSIWIDFNEQAKTHMSGILNRLQAKGLTSEERSRLGAYAASHIQNFLDSAEYSAFRAAKLNEFTKGLRNYLGPLINFESERFTAGRDVGSVTLQAFDTAVKMHVSGWTFHFTYPECGSKFLDSSMICRDDNNKETGLSMQLRQARIKWVITPVVTMRDDRGIAIRVKQLASANVLTTG